MANPLTVCATIINSLVPTKYMAETTMEIKKKVMWIYYPKDTIKVDTSKLDHGSCIITSSKTGKSLRMIVPGARIRAYTI